MVRRANLKHLIRDAIIKGIRRNGDRIFNTSQNTASCFVPVSLSFPGHIGGTLKLSGYTKKLENGVEIGYTAPYASMVERGGPAVPYSGIQTVHVKAHKRKAYIRRAYYNKKTGIEISAIEVPAGSISAHTRQYINKRVIAFRPKLSKFEGGPLIFRILKEQPERKGQFFLTRALKQELSNLYQDIEFYLRRIPGIK